MLCCFFKLHPDMQAHILLLLLTGVTVLNCSKQNGNNLGHVLDRTLHQKSSELIRTARSDLKTRRIKPAVLRRQKREWILGTFSVTEEEEPPFPKHIATLHNDFSVDHVLSYMIKGPGIDQDPERGLFTVNATSGDLFITRKVDREEHPYFLMSVYALRDIDKVNLDRFQVYKINVKDINDNPPVFTKIEEKLSIHEFLEKGQPVYTIQASDKDEKKNQNSKISYNLLSETPSSDQKMFAINPDTGNIMLQGCLDYQKSNVYSLVISARDHGFPKALTSTTTLDIHIIDGNNYPPVFESQSVLGTVRETDINSAILRVKVTDKDLPNTPAWRAKYKITKGNEHGNFKIVTDAETNDGIVILIKQMDYEGGPQRQLEIDVENEEPLFFCGDNKQISRTMEPNSKSAVIQVVDENDAPVFEKPNIKIKRTEGLQPGDKLATVRAFDPDKLYKNKIRYAKAFDPEELVSVDEVTGEVKTIKEVDRESRFVNGTHYDILIHAIDDAKPPLTGTVTLHLHIKDVNDNSPYLVSPEQYVCLDSNVQYVDLKAADDDMDPFGGPFIFTFGDSGEPGIEKWKFDKIKDDSARLLREGDLVLGYYNLPIVIQDRQGTTTEKMFKLRVCHCTHDNECKSLSDTRSIGFDIVIGMLFAALLLLLLILCLLLLCNFDVKNNTNVLHYEEACGTLTTYNEEGGGALSEQAFQASLKRLSRSNTLPCHAMKPQNSFGYLGAQRLNDTRRHSSVITTNSRYVKPLEDCLNQRIYFHNFVDDVRDAHVPCTYLYEGREDSLISVASLTHTEQSGSYTFLSQLGSRFNDLAEVCQLKHQG